MSVDVLERTEVVDVVDRWRSEAGADNPAGPLYTGGRYAEADIIVSVVECTGRCSSCTASTTVACC